MRAAILLFSLLWSPLAAAEPVALTLDPGHSTIYALVYKDGMASSVAHDHVVQAGKVSGQGTWDAENVANSRIEVAVSVTGLVADADAMRQRVGLPNTLSSSQRDEITSHILASYQLYAEKYDSIRFVSKSVSKTADGYSVTGDFTLRGVSKTISVPMTVVETPDGLRARGKFRILQSEYGYSPYSALFGALRVKDHVDVHLDVLLKA